MLKFHKTPEPGVVQAVVEEVLPVENPVTIEYLAQEATFENIEAFVRGRRRASCSELMAAFRVSYRDAVKMMDALEERGVVEPIKSFAGFPVSAGARAIACSSEQENDNHKHKGVCHAEPEVDAGVSGAVAVE